jgi:hypothetical protein
VQAFLEVLEATLLPEAVGVVAVVVQLVVDGEPVEVGVVEVLGFLGAPGIAATVEI